MPHEQLDQDGANDQNSPKRLLTEDEYFSGWRADLQPLFRPAIHFLADNAGPRYFREVTDEELVETPDDLKYEYVFVSYEGKRVSHWDVFGASMASIMSATAVSFALLLGYKYIKEQQTHDEKNQTRQVEPGEVKNEPTRQY